MIKEQHDYSHVDARVLLPTKGEVNNEEKTAIESEKEKENERVPAFRARSDYAELRRRSRHEA